MLHITTTSHLYSCQPKTKDELKKIIIQRIKEDGLECDLNDIDVSQITNMGNLFNAFDKKIFKNFNGDISRWNVSNVDDMSCMFFNCEKFNCDLSKWDVSNVKDMGAMFYNCYKFNCDLSNWNVSNVEEMYNAFHMCPTKPEWYEPDWYDYIIKQR